MQLGTWRGNTFISPNVRPTVLYRLYDEDDNLLYIGITCGFDARMRDHAHRHPWWPLVARTVLDWFDTDYEADRAETAAIRAERPRYNVGKRAWGELTQEQRSRLRVRTSKRSPVMTLGG